MKRLLTIVLTLALCVGMIPTVGFADSTVQTKSQDQPKTQKSFTKKQEPKQKEGEAIVLFEDDSNTSAASSVKGFQAKLPKGIKIEEKLDFDGTAEIDSKSAKSSSTKSKKVNKKDFTVMLVSSDKYSTNELIKSLKKEKGVKYVEANKIVKASATNDPFYKNQWSLENTGQNAGTPGKDIGVNDIWTKSKGSKDNVVAVIDSGIDTTHPDLKDNLWNNPSTTKLKGRHGYNFVEANTNVSDAFGHGTHVSGIIGAKGDNGIGISGVNQDVSIMTLRVLDEDGSGETMDIISSFKYIQSAQNLGINVVAANMSLGYYDTTEPEIMKTVIDTVGSKGCVTVCAAGNERLDIDEDPMYPAAINSPYILSIGASDEKGNKATFTNTGDKNVDLYAPGTSILSTVNYPQYNAGIDSSKNQYFEDYESGFSTSDYIRMDSVSGGWDPTNKNTDLSVVNDSYYGESGGKGLKWSIKDAEEGDVYNLCVPYASDKSSTGLYANAMVNIKESPEFYDDWVYGAVVVMSDSRILDNGELPDRYKTGAFENEVPFTATDYSNDYWESVGGKIRNTFNKDETPASNRVMVFTLIVNSPGDHEIILDDVGISKPETTDSDFDNYDVYSGTSMATPIVAGAIPLIKSQNPTLSAKQIVANVKKMTDNNDNFDLSKYDTQGPLIDSYKINSDKSITLTGEVFGTSTGAVYANGTQLNTTSWSDKSITIDKAHYNSLINRKVEFKIDNSGKTVSETFFVVDNKKAFTKYGKLDSFSGGNFINTGSTMYYISDYGTLYTEMWVEDDGDDDWEDWSVSANSSAKAEKVKEWVPIAGLDKAAVFPSASTEDRYQGYTTFETDVVYLNGKLYGIAELSLDYMSYYSLASYDLKTKKWSRIADRPGAETKGAADKDFSNVELPVLSTYNGSLYLMGGLNMIDYTASTKVRVFNVSKKTWAKGTDLPEGRFLSTGQQVGNNLVVSMGSDGKNTGSVPATLVFNGKTWSVGEGISNPLRESVYYLPTDKDDPEAVDIGYFYEEYYRPVKYYNTASGLVKDGVIFTGLHADGLGDTYIFDVKTKKFKATNYQYSQKISEGDVVGTTLHDKFYVATIPTMDEMMDEEDFWFEDDYYEMEDSVEMYTMPVSSGLCKVSGKTKNGKINGRGRYLPGQKVTLKTSPKKKYYTKKFVVDGKKIKGTKTSIPYITKDVKVAAKFAKFKTKVVLSAKKKNAKVGQKFKLKAKLKKSPKKKSGVVWKTSNKKYATVNKKGVVKIKKAGKGKTVYITAKAKDGSKAKAKCKIKISN